MNERISLVDAFKYFWRNPKKWTATFIWFGLYVGISFAFGILYLPAMIPFVGLLWSCILVPVFLILELAGMSYVIDFCFEVINNSKESKSDFPEIFTNFKKRALNGLKIILYSFIYYLPGILFVVILYVLYFVFIVMFSELFGDSAEIVEVILIILVSLLFYVGLFVAMALNKFMVDAANYRYIMKRDLNDAMNFRVVFKIFKKGMKENFKLLIQKIFLVLIMIAVMVVLYAPFFVLLILAGSDERYALLSILAFCLYFIGIFASMLFYAPITLYIQPHLTGQMFRLWDKKGLNKIK